MSLSNEQVEVLSFSDLSICFKPWQEAVCDVFGGRAEIVAEHEHLCIGMVDGKMPLPTIIKFKTLDSATKSYKRGALKYTREGLYNRDCGNCQYCGKHIPRSVATVDHVIPRAKGGVTAWDNCVLSCAECNNKKGNRTPAEAGMRLLKAPVRPKVPPPAVRI